MEPPRATSVGPVFIRTSSLGFKENHEYGSMDMDMGTSHEAVSANGNPIGAKVALSGYINNNKRWEAVLAYSNGSCTKFDYVHNEVKQEYKPAHYIPPYTWSDIWELDAPSLNGYMTKYLVAASNNSSTMSAFCSWEFHTTELKATRTHSSQGRDSSAAYNHFHEPSGPVMMYGICGQKKATLFDIRDGDELVEWELHSPLKGLAYSRPMQWRNANLVVINSYDYVSVWDINSTKPSPILKCEAYDGPVKGLAVNRVDHIMPKQDSGRTTLYGGFDGIYCTNESIYVMDVRSRRTNRIRLPIKPLWVTCVSYCGDTIIIGCYEVENISMPVRRDMIITISLREGTFMRTYYLPLAATRVQKRDITQVWTDEKKIVGLNTAGLCLFSEETIRSSTEDMAGNSKTINKCTLYNYHELDNPKLSCSSDGALVTSTNQLPFLCSI